MDEQPEFQLVRDTWDAFNRDDLDAALEGIHEDVVIVPFGAAMEGKRYEGHAEVVHWYRNEIRANWEEFETHPHEFRRIGGRLLVYGRWRARGRDSGIELDVPATWVIDVRDGKIAGWQTYTDREEAHAAVGLRS
jgi:ketosteroid isomerase-like protein